MPLPKYSNEPNFVGYPYYYVIDDSVCECNKCAEESLQAGKTPEPNVNWDNKQLYCFTCSEKIEHAYEGPSEEAEEPSEEAEEPSEETEEPSEDAEIKFLFNLFMGAKIFLD